MAEVVVALRDGQEIVSVITVESVRRLRLAEGSAVIAVVKSTEDAPGDALGLAATVVDDVVLTPIGVIYTPFVEIAGMPIRRLPPTESAG